jgi:hypothetical protein
MATWKMKQKLYDNYCKKRSKDERHMGAGSRSCPVRGSNISGVETLGSVTRINCEIWDPHSIKYLDFCLLSFAIVL